MGSVGATHSREGGARGEETEWEGSSSKCRERLRDCWLLRLPLPLVGVAIGMERWRRHFAGCGIVGEELPAFSERAPGAAVDYRISSSRMALFTSEKQNVRCDQGLRVQSGGGSPIDDVMEAAVGAPGHLVVSCGRGESFAPPAGGCQCAVRLQLLHQCRHVTVLSTVPVTQQEKQEVLQEPQNSR